MNRKTESKIVSELMSKLEDTIREGEYGSWSDLWCGMELPKPFPAGFQINVWGEEGDALTDGNSYSVNICRDDTDQLGCQFQNRQKMAKERLVDRNMSHDCLRITKRGYDQ